MPENAAQTEQEMLTVPDFDEDDGIDYEDDYEDYLSEEEEEELEERARRKMSRLARGCLEMAAMFLLLAGGFLLLETKEHLSVLYILPPYTLMLGCVAASFFSMMSGLFSLRKNAFAMMIMVLGGWMVLFVMAMSYLQQPETILQRLPGVSPETTIQMTLVSTPISSSLYIEEPIRENLLARRWKFPVHDKNIPLDELVSLQEEEDGTVTLAFEGQIWAFFDPDTGEWADVLHYEEEDSVEETQKPSKNH